MRRFMCGTTCTLSCMDSNPFGKVVELREITLHRIEERKRIRQRCLELQDELDEVLTQAQFIDAEDRDLEYLPRTAHSHCVDADSLIRKYSRPMNDEVFHHQPDKIEDEILDEIRDHLESAVQSIDRYNFLVLWGMRISEFVFALIAIALIAVKIIFWLL